MYAKRLLSIPHGPFKGGRRAYALRQPRKVYTPNWGIDRKVAPDGSIVETYKAREIRDFIGPTPAITKRPPFFDYVRNIPSIDPPPKAHFTYLKETVIVPSATNVGSPELPVFRPGEISLPEMYTVPNNYTYEIKKLLIIPYDTSYETLFVTILTNGGPSCHLQGANVLDPADYPGSEIAGGGYELLPNLPQDQFNSNLRVRAGDRVGIRIINDSFGEREVHVAIFGWKYQNTYELGMLGLK